MPLQPYLVKLVRQNGMNTDCAVASLSMLVGCNYEEALAACASVAPEVLDAGMSWADIRRAADVMGVGVRLLARGRYDIDEATGLLNVRNRHADHAVFLWAGRVIEGNGELWLDPDDYLRHYKYRPYSLMVREDE